MPVAPANYLDWQKDAQSFESFAVSRLASFNPSGEIPERLMAARVSVNLFSVLAVAPALGPAFVAGDDPPVKGSVAILSSGLWQRRFAGDRGIVGRTVRANDQKYMVVGVMLARIPIPDRVALKRG